MTQTRNELVNRLSDLAREMQEICESLAVPVAAVSRVNTPKEVAALIAAGKCLNCREPRPAGENRRGCDDACYSMLNGRKNRKEFTDADLVRAGLFLPAQKGGRKPAKPREGMGFTKLQQAMDEKGLRIGRRAAKDAEKVDKVKKPQ